MDGDEDGNGEGVRMGMERGDEGGNGEGMRMGIVRG